MNHVAETGVEKFKLKAAIYFAVIAPLAACIPQSHAADAPHRTPAPVRQVRAPAQAPVPQAPVPMPQAVAPTISPATARARAILDAKLLSLGRAFNGHAGLAVRDVQTGWTTAYNGNDYMPQQSVSKFWVALTALEKADHGALDLDRRVVVRRDDLTLFHQPIATLVDGDGYATTLGDLLIRALTQSDNTANDFILWSVGGPDAVRAFLKRHDIDGVRFGPGERLLQSQTAGLSWKQEYSRSGAFQTARAKLPISVREAALQRYLADPIDGATALGLVTGLTKLKQGELLSPTSTARLLDTMSHTKTGPQRLKGGLVPGWSLAHKTGTGQNLGGTTAGYNDVGILTAPDGHSYAIAVLIGRTTVSIPERQKLMNEAVRAVIAYEDNQHGA
jgi:beta-lactamase class A